VRHALFFAQLNRGRLGYQKLLIFTFGLVFLLIAAGGGVWFVLSNFEKIAEEGITFSKVSGYVDVDGLSVPVSKGRKFTHYMYLDAKIELTDRSKTDVIFAKLPFFRDQALRELHRTSVLRQDGVPGIDIRAIKERLKARAVEIYGDKLINQILVTKLVFAAN
jgi:flagellar basal body-associated protein FliL